MRILFFLVFFVLSFCANAQDTCTFSFTTSNATVGKVHQDKMLQFIANRSVESAMVVGYFSSVGDASRNRIAADNQIRTLRETLLNNNIPFNQIQTKIVSSDSGVSENVVEVVFKFLGVKGNKVLKKTSVVQISEVNLNLERPPMPVVKKREKVTEKPAEKVDNDLLAAESFKKNETITIPNLLFEGGTHYFLAGSERVLNQLLNVMQKNPKLRIELQGHICCRFGGMDGYDPATGQENLSEMRARSVYLFLKDGGIAENRMTYRGFGSSRKLYEADFGNAMAAQQNRRVEVLVVDTE